MDIKETILKAFKDSKEPLKVGQLAEITGIDKKEVDKVIKTLKADETIHSPKRCFYELKK